jgi:Brp/Blh family beta-carotene 15,15'-monooxygenase
MDKANRAQRAAFLIAALGALALVTGGVGIPFTWQLALLVFSVALLGLPHGAIDPLVARRKGIWRNPASLANFLALYLLLAGAYGLFWWLAPGLALTAFLLYAACHFSGDWEAVLDSRFRWLLGLAIVALPTWSHPEQVGQLFSVLSNDAATNIIVSAGQLVGPAVLAGGVALAVLAWRKSAASGIEITLLLATASLLPPLVFFAIYFGLLHSPRHLFEELGKLRLPASKVVLTSGVTLLATALLAVAAWPVLGAASFDESVIRLVFIGLASLTVPHMLLVEHQREPWPSGGEKPAQA